MTIDEWIARAADEEAITLHKFNFLREKKFASPAIDEAHADFEVYLSRVDAASDTRTADEILWAFSQEMDSPDRTLIGPPRDHRFPDPSVHISSRPVFLKHLGMPPGYLLRLGFDQAEIDQTILEVAAALAAGAVDARLEEHLAEMVDQLRRPSPVFAPPPVRAAPGGRIFAGAPATTFGNEPWWFTLEDALIGEQRRLPDRASPLQRSGYVAGVRAALGVYNFADTASDAAAAPAIRFRILIQIVTDPAAVDNFAWRQPGVFSGGFRNLFVSYPRSPGGGRTVRLVDRECQTHPACDCGEDGLPEGVVPAFALFSPSASLVVRGAYLALHRDLSRFSPPICDEIRAKRAT